LNNSDIMRKVFILITTILLFNVDGNCQVKPKISNDQYLSQLTPEELNEQLGVHKKMIYFDIGALAIGTTFIIVGSNLLKKADEEPLTLEGAYDYTFETVFGYILLPTGIIIDLGGLVLLPLNLSQISKINKILENSEIKVGFMTNPPQGIYNTSFIAPIPGISVTIRF